MVDSLLNTSGVDHFPVEHEPLAEQGMVAVSDSALEWFSVQTNAPGGPRNLLDQRLLERVQASTMCGVGPREWWSLGSHN